MPEPTVVVEPSISDLRSMLAPVVEAQPAVTEPVITPVVTPLETASEPVAQPTVVPVTDEPLPDGVQKRIAKEVERQSGIQRKIDEAVSNRKAKEAELASLAAIPGSAPAPTPAPAKDSKPVRPEFGKEGQTWAQYQEETKSYESNYEAWLTAETTRTVEQRFAANQAQEASKAKWDAAVKTHGAEFPALMDTAKKSAPEGLQLAISSLDDWSGVAVHLARDPAKLAELSAQYAANPYAAIAKLGRIEASLKPATQPAAAAPLPAPPAKAGGGASAGSVDFNYETASMSQLRTQVAKIRKA